MPIEESQIKTLFSFSTEGYEEATNRLDNLLSKYKQLKQASSDTAKAEASNATQLKALSAEWQKLNTLIDTTGTATKEQRERFAEVAKTVKELNSDAYTYMKTQKELATEIKATTKEIKAMEAQQQSYDKVLKLINSDQALATNSTKSLKLAQAELRKQLETMERGTTQYVSLSQALAKVDVELKSVRDNQRLLTAETGAQAGSVEALRAEVSRLTTEWKRLDPQTQKFKDTEMQLADTTKALMDMEARVGKFGRNVGNYSGQFNMLNHSMAQITREAPAFANSMQTGFMAISNNIPMLVDEITRLKEANKAMNAEGKKTPSVLSSVGKALFSWQTGLSLAVTLLTVFGAKMFDWIGSLFDSKDALDANTMAQRQLNDALFEGRKAAQQEVSNLEFLRKATTNTTLSMEARIKAVKDIQEQYPAYFKDLSQEAILEGKVGDAYIRTTQALIAKAQNEVLAQKLAEDSVKKVTLERLKSYEELRKAQEEYEKGITETETITTLEGSVIRREENVAKGRLTRAIAEFKKELKEIDFDLFEQLENKRVQEYLDETSVRIDFFTDAMAQNLEAIADYSGQSEEAIVKSSQTASKAVHSTSSAWLSAYKELKDAELELQEARYYADEETVKQAEALVAQRLQIEQQAKAKGVKLTEEEETEKLQIEYDYAKKSKELKDEQFSDFAEGLTKQYDAYFEAVKAQAEAEKELREAELSGNKSEEELQVLKEQLQLRTKTVSEHLMVESQLTEEHQNVLAKIRAKGLDKAKEQNYEGIQLIHEQLTKSIATMNQYLGDNGREWNKAANSIAGFVTTAVDLGRVNNEIKELDKSSEDYEKTLEKLNKQQQDVTQMLITMGATASMGVFSAITNDLNEQLEAQKALLDAYYEDQEKRTEASYNKENALLENKLEKGEITEVKYRLEQMRLDRELADEQEKLSREKAQAQYEIEKQQFELEQANSLAGIAMATALGIAQAWAATGATLGLTTPVAIALTAALAAIGAAQTAMVLAQEPPAPPKYEKGGAVRFEKIEGPSHSNGGVPIAIGDKVVGEAEGDEGALIISKKAMRNSYMKRLLAQVEAENRAISGGGTGSGLYADGGAVDFKSENDFYEQILSGLSIKKRDWNFWGTKVNSITLNNGAVVDMSPYGKDGDRVEEALRDYASEEASKQYKEYDEAQRGQFENKEAQLNEGISGRINNNSTLKGMGITDIDQYNTAVTANEEQLESVENKIQAYEDMANASIEALKVEMEYDETLAKLDEKRADASEELAEATMAFNKSMLDDLLKSGAVTEAEYLTMLDQITLGYGATSEDIIAIKTAEVEKVKELIEEQRTAELEAVEATANYRATALEQIRTEWESEYDSITQSIIDDVESATKAVTELSGTDLERYNQMLEIQQRITAMNDKYEDNEGLLSDGVIESRAERETLLAEQHRIQEELQKAEEEAEEAKEAFEAEREKNMEASRLAWETANFDTLLSQLTALGAEMQATAEAFGLDNYLAEQLEKEVSNINTLYDEQIASQNAIIDGYSAELEKAQLLHDKKVAMIDAEQQALEKSFNAQKETIDQWLTEATRTMRSEASGLASTLATLKLAGIEVGLAEYESALADLLADIEAFDKISSTSTPTYADGGAIEIGNGVYSVTGKSHAMGGVPIMVGGRKIAEVEDAEKLLAVSKRAINDPEMKVALARVSAINERNGGKSLGNYTPNAPIFELDYDRLAKGIGREINNRPVVAQLEYDKIYRANRRYNIDRSMRRMV